VDEHLLKWIRHTKRSLLRAEEAEFRDENLRVAVYRPFTKQQCFVDRIFNEDLYLLPRILPDARSEQENRLICTVTEEQMPFSAQMTNCLPCLHFGGRQTQCFPFYSYAENGSNRRENITDWALKAFQTHYHDKKISKWDIFHFVYAVLHHPHYRERYAANLRRELPRIPYTSNFRDFAAAGKRLADLHVNYEQQEEYWWHRIENPKVPLSYRVEKMKISKDKRSILYNEFLTIGGIPPEVFEYRLGNRSALEWVIDQYQVSTDKRSGITNDPNRLDDPEYILRLIGQVITVSLETAKIVKGLPPIQKDRARKETTSSQ
jgi:predicted helicase